MKKIFVSILTLCFFLFDSCRNKEKETSGSPYPCLIEIEDEIDRIKELLYFDTLGNLIKIEKKINDKKETLEFTYNYEGKLIELFDKENREYERYEYDNSGKIVKELVYDDSISIDNLKEFEEHQYDVNGLRIKTNFYEVSQNSSPKAVEVESYIYNSRGDLIEIHTELIKEKKKFKETIITYTDIQNKIKYPLGYTSFIENFLPKQKTIFSINGDTLNSFEYFYTLNKDGFINKKIILGLKKDAVNKLVKDTLSKLNFTYQFCSKK